MAESLREKTAGGFLWNSLDYMGVALVNFLTTVILSRLLAPDIFGQIAMLEIFILVSMIFIESGFTTALIRKQDRTADDETTVFLCNLGAALILGGAFYLCAPLIGEFYGRRGLTSVTRLLAVTLPVNALGIVQISRLRAEMQFRKLTAVNVASAIVSAITATICALTGQGIYALVWQQISLAATRSLLLWLTGRGFRFTVFSRSSFLSLFGYSWKLMVSWLIYTVYTNLYAVVIGKLFTPSAAGLFWRSRSLAYYPATAFTSVVQGVSFPAMSKIQETDTRLRSAYATMLRMSAWGLFPVMIWLSVFARPVTVFLFSEKWLPCVPYIRIVALALALYPIHAINLNLLCVKGRSDLFLRLEIIKTLIGIALLAGGSYFGVTGICWGLLLNSLISLTLNTRYTSPLIQLSLRRQIGYLVPALLMGSAAAGSVLAALTPFSLSATAETIFSLLLTGAVYYGQSLLFTPGNVREFRDMRTKMKRKREAAAAGA